MNSLETLELADYYRSIIEVMSEGIAILRKDGTVVDANTSAALMLGVPKEVVLGRRLLDLRWKAINESGQPILKEDHPALVTLRTGRAIQGMTMGVSTTADKTIWLSVNTSPMFRPGETEPYAVVASFTDITQERLATQAVLDSEARFRRLSDASLDGVVIADHGVITEVNRAVTRIFGYTEEELVGQHSIVLIAPETRATAEIRIREGLEGSYHTLGLHKDGVTRIPLLVVANMIVSNNRKLRVTVIRDLRESDRLDRMQREFIATVSHELRTPLTSIRGALGLLHGGAAGALSERGQHLTRVALANSERLMALINDLLDLEQIEMGSLPFHPTVIAPIDVVRRAVEKMIPMAKSRSIRIAIDVQTDSTIWADPDRLVQVLVNLLSNAIKFSSDDSDVTISATEMAARTADLPATQNRVRFAVTDRGSGIEPVLVDRLFKKFTQADSSDVRQQGGTGLGLPIAQAIVRQHGGTIVVESEPHQKTTFWFTIPKAQRTEPH
jgi:PAS domain S-box-containing protein